MHFVRKILDTIYGQVYDGITIVPYILERPRKYIMELKALMKNEDH